MTSVRNFETILVTGAAGFIGGELVHKLLRHGYRVLAVDDLSKGERSNLPEKENDRFRFYLEDLRNRNAALKVIRDCDWVIHLASQAYGVAYCSKSHASTFLLNSQINANVIEAVKENRIPGLLAVSSSCVYSDTIPDIMTEDLGFFDEPESVNWGYGWAKRMMEVAVLAGVKDSTYEGMVVRPVNIYGASYGWFGEHSHVIPSLVKRILDGENPLCVWGDGTQARNFLHVRDAARALLESSIHAPNGAVFNLGDEQATSINEIADMLKDLLSVDFQVTYDPEKPTGRKVKKVSSRLLKEILPDFTPQVSMQEGLKEMKEWYERHKSKGSF